MAIVTTDDQNYKDIADAIREKGVAGSFTPAQMAGAIGTIDSADYTLTIEAENGSVVTAVKGAISVSGTAANNVCVLHVPEAGVYTVTSVLDGQSTQASVTASADQKEILRHSYITYNNMYDLFEYDTSIFHFIYTDNGLWISYYSGLKRLGFRNSHVTKNIKVAWDVEGDFEDGMITIKISGTQINRTVKKGVWESTLYGGGDLCFECESNSSDETVKVRFFMSEYIEEI